MFGYEKRETYPVYISKEKFNDMIHLLLITKGKEQHYVLIKDFNKFMYNQSKKVKHKHFNKDMKLKKDDEQNFKNAYKDVRVRDH